MTDRRTGTQAVIPMLLCLTAFGAVAYAFNREAGFWSPDSALRFVQVESLSRSGFRDVAVPYPAADLDPSGRFFPASSWFHFQRDGRNYLSYPPYFPAASAVPYRLFGHYGLLVLPLVGGLLAVWITFGALRGLAPGTAAWGAAAVGLATPLLVYSGLFWDHSLAVALATGAFALTAGALARGEESTPRGLLAAGALLGLGFWLRNEMYLLAVALGLAWLLTSASGRRRDVLPLAAGAVAAALPAWLMNLRLYGSPMGWKGQSLVVGRSGEAVEAVAGGGASAWLADRLANVYHHLFALDFATIWADVPGVPQQAVTAGALVAGLLLGAGWLLRTGVRRRWDRAIGGAAVLAAGGVTLALSGRTMLAGLLPTLPLTVLIFLPGRWTRWERFVAIMVVLYTSAVIATGSHAGLQWGPRYLLPVVPLLVWLAAAAVLRTKAQAPEVWPVMRVTAGVLVGLSLLVQMAGVDYVATWITNNVRAREVLRSAPSRVVASAMGHLIMGAGPVYFEKQLMLVGTIEDFEALVRSLAQQRVPEWTYIPRLGPGFDPRPVTAWTEGGPWRYLPVGDRSPYPTLRMVTYRGFPSDPPVPR